MYKNSHSRSFVFSSHTGCFLPLLIILNLLFGWILFKPKEWLIIEAILILFLIINGYIMTKKIVSASSKKRGDVIDVEGEVVRDKRHLK